MKKLSLPRRQSYLALWQRQCFEGIMQWERALRILFVESPKFVFERFEGSQKLVSFFFVYVMLQALAILWGFLFSVGAILGESMSSIVAMSFFQAFCVLFVYVSVMGILLQFGRATWILTWQSTQNFPLIRRIIARECRPQAVIITVALPMLLILPSLILVPSGCDESLLYGPWVKAMCEESYLKFLTEKHPVFQRSLRISTAITIAQFIQLCLEILPRWRSALSGLSVISAFILGGWLVTLNFVGGMWSVEWVARHFNYKITPLSNLTAFQWEVFGMTLLIAWILWFIAVACHTFENVRECEPSQKKLAGFFERLKYTFVFAQAIVFFRACVHPNMGFVHAQLELTIINLLLPSIYVVSLIMLRMMLLLNVRSVLTSVPLALGVGAVIFFGSRKTERPHSFVVVSLFLFDIFLRWSTAMPELSSRLPNSIQQLLKQTNANTRGPLAGYKPAKLMVYLGFAILLLFVGALSSFSILSDLQKNAKWFPDATSVAFENSSIHIHHTAIVKLHLGLAETPAEAMHLNIPSYASCANRFNGLTLVDVALLAEAAYFNPASNDTADFVATIFSNSFSAVEVRFPTLNTKTGSKLDFFETYFPSLNTSVISVRGTDIWRPTDFIEDVKMFFEPVVFAVLSAIFPTIRIWPDVTFSTLIELYSELISLFGLRHESWYYHELLAYVSSIDDREVVLTGHSMGGGIARLVGSILRKPSVTFSPPGFVQSYSKLVHDIGGMTTKVNRENIHHLSVAVIPEYDPVTMIDVQAGMIQKISCDTPNLSMQLSCHMLEGTLCNLLENCGDPRGRISSCKFEHKITSVTDDIIPKLAAVLSPEVLITLAVTAAILLSTFLRRRRTSLPAPSPSHRRGRPSASPARRHHHHGHGGRRRNSIY